MKGNLDDEDFLLPPDNSVGGEEIDLLEQRCCYHANWETYETWLGSTFADPYVSIALDDDLVNYEDQHLWKDMEAEDRLIPKGS